MNNSTKLVDIPIQAIQVADIICELCSQDLAGIYLYGSAVQSKLRPNSDIDILVICKKTLSDKIRVELTKRLLELSGNVGNIDKRPLEVTVINQKDIFPFQFPPKCDYMYGEWLRPELESGKIPTAYRDPDVTILLWQARKYSVLIRGNDISGIIPHIPKNKVMKAIKVSLPELISTIHGDERNVLLTLARMWFTVSTNNICSKDYAATWVLPKLPQDLAPLMELALNIYIGKSPDTWIMSEEKTILLVNFLRKSIENAISRKHKLDYSHG
ncbi:aminoglycoside adenylyltransferase family protein [Fusibacillus kribbianus]|uniref:Aminoglycoside adenylyltransferase family protein n=1 Tax=Fusibacillus kribbianus TaxID=3044208 RepID=A0AAP4BD51_9FIRM|nr:aminoglycoside adenylyltransferase family protein [Ruminococcus sp. YH-rum2234]MDI9242119.1 aminoglycoside adenylyltransferase family protein [Ruminococcus sp. YH-rum2234]